MDNNRRDPNLNTVVLHNDLKVGFDEREVAQQPEAARQELGVVAVLSDDPHERAHAKLGNLGSSRAESTRKWEHQRQQSDSLW